jgi:hypothetical protein
MDKTGRNVFLVSKDIELPVLKKDRAFASGKHEAMIAFTM